MKTARILALASLSLFATALTSACAAPEEGAAAGAGDEGLGEAMQELLAGNKFLGSDTLKTALTSSISTYAIAGISYAGTGSSNGARCLLGTAAAGSTGAVAECVGTARQTIAPMSRALAANECTNAKGIKLKSHVVGLDSVNAFVFDGNAAADTFSQLPGNGVSQAQLKQIYCGDGTGSAATCAGDWGAVGRAAAGAIQKYRRDDASGTTDTFKSILGCTNFCADTTSISDPGTTGSKPTATGPNAATVASVCQVGDSATACIGRLTAAAASGANAIGYSGDAALRAGNNALKVDGVVPSADNVRKLLTGGAGAYPLARRLYVNESVSGTGRAVRTAAEQSLLNSVLGAPQAGAGQLPVGGAVKPGSVATRRQFNTILQNNGFVTCSSNLDQGCTNLEACL